MSGHSKWAQIKRKKAATDAARGRAFSRIILEITLAARHGGGDPEGNPRLRSAIASAKAANMPAGNIERAIKRGTGEIEGVRVEEIHYEGYGPGGVAILVEVATDNRNRTAGDIRNLFAKHGGNLGEAGSVAYLFKPRGVIEVARAAVAEDVLMEAVLDAGAEDVRSGEDAHVVLTPPAALDAVREALASRGIPVASAELSRVPSIQVPIGEREAAALFRLVDVLEEHDDVHKVHVNAAVDDDVIARLSR
jgi:YebC/PmpR family DNA-binding regulatory protein